MAGKSYKLTYFNLKGRAELARIIFAHAGVEYEDNRIEREDWPEIKSTAPFGQVPILEVDGEVLAQSTSISRFLAKEFDLAGKDNWEQARADMFVDTCNDLVEAMVLIYKEKDSERKSEMESELKSTTLPKFIGYMEKHLEANGGNFFVGSELTWADISIAFLVSGIKKRIESDLFKDFPLLDAFSESVMELPNIKNWIETRPQTEF